ncbi:Oidioi.mRNA.OKI2018_I69.chr2.g5398.t1.cds [Oikopleura dioica]|uniref:DNA-directed DNA polymerase n=1 Tax=Oikopleura dioica TaxID=34765 RepID=A0ABN7T4J1_OIKDI|nr:Oidioi.mRNA.OKI2018_I69.chr2.g5398.t1.cds [Oikopleura dioica]
MVNEKMRHGKFPREVNTMCFHADGILLTTNLLQFYLDLGLEVTQIHYGVLYNKEKPFGKFIKDVVSRRVHYSKPDTKNDVAANRAKLIMSSAIGKFGENPEKRDKVQFLPLEKLWFQMRKPHFIGYEVMDAEGDTNIVNIKQKRKRIKDDLATHMNG